MASLVKQARLATLLLAKGAGILSLVRDSSWRQQRLLILAWHGISIDDEHEWNPCLFMPQDLFRRRLEALARGGYSVLPLQEAVERLYARDLPARAVTLTFDDGTDDFRTRACPVLAEFGFPSTVYLTTYYAANRYPVFNVFLSYMFWKGRRGSVDLPDLIPGHVRYHLSTVAERETALAAIREFTQREKLTNDQQVTLAQDLAAQLGIDYHELCEKRILHIMAPAHIRELKCFGATVQLHTHRHRTPMDESLFRREIRDNREWIARFAGTSDHLTHFCYPGGVYDPAFFPWLAAEHIRTATTCDSGLAWPHCGPLLLPRLIDTCNITPLEFEGWLTGMSHLLPRRRRAHVQNKILTQQHHRSLE